MRRTRPNSDLESGQDAFLDIVANLVGILIIMVMVVGVRTKEAWVEAADEVPQSTEDAAQLEAEKLAVEQMESDVHAIAAEAQRLGLTVAARRQERSRIQLLITALEKSLEERKGALDEDQRQEFELRERLAARQTDLAQLRRQAQATQDAASAPIVLEHLPTPMAKTVFGDEAHFRLLAGRIVEVPWDQLVQRLKQEAPDKLWKLRDAPSITETIGPIDGFRMHYTLRKVNGQTHQRTETVAQQRIELERFTLSAVPGVIGETVDAALAENSAFARAVARRDPRRTTITVWTYPDGFEDFRRVKQWLHDRGFLSAGRPLPEGFPIGGAPTGTRSAAQ